MDAGILLQGRGQGQSRVLVGAFPPASSSSSAAASTVIEAAIFSGDVSDDEDLTPSGSGIYLQGALLTETPRHTRLLQPLKGQP